MWKTIVYQKTSNSNTILKLRLFFIICYPSSKRRSLRNYLQNASQYIQLSVADKFKIKIKTMLAKICLKSRVYSCIVFFISCWWNKQKSNKDSTKIYSKGKKRWKLSSNQAIFFFVLLNFYNRIRLKQSMNWFSLICNRQNSLKSWKNSKIKGQNRLLLSNLSIL